MNHQLKVSKAVIINAPLAKVWDGLTNPESIKEYLFGTETITDWKEGSPIVFQGEYQGQSYKDKGIVQKNILNQELSYLYWTAFSGLEDTPDNYSLITYSLKDMGNSITELIWAQEGFANEDGYNHSVNGMDAFLESVKAIIER